jgi:tetratricopeptide (TPR) repeat protein
MAGRLQERNRWAVWLAGEVRKGGFNSAVAHRDIDEARALLSQGEPRKAIEKLEALIVRLRTTTEFDAAFVRANACEMLGSVYVMVGGGQKAIPVLRDAVQQWEALVDKEHAAGKDTDTERGNLAGALGSLAHALCDADALDEALRAAERGVAVTSEIGHHRNLASTTLAAARTLMKQGRITDAAARYDEALRAAQRAGDRELEGITLQNQGSLAYNNGQHDRAAKLYERALQLFQDMDDENGVLQTCAFLGAVEQNAGRLAEARAWYERSREIAVRRGNQPSIWAAAQSLGIVYQLEGKSAWKQGDEARARERLTEAARMVNEALRVGIESEDTPREAVSHGNLGLIYCLLGDLDKAEEHAHHARDIHERLGLKEAHIDYNTLAAIARARNNPTEAAVWEQKRDALRAELERRAGAIAPPAEQGHED